MTQSKLYEMAVRGTEYKEDYEFEGYGGEEVTVIFQPLVDDEFLPLAAFLAERLDLDEEAEPEEAATEAIDRADEATDNDGDVDIGELDEDFVEVMQTAAKMGIYGGYTEDGDEVEHTEEEIDFIVENLMGGYSIELGGKVLEVSGDVRKADKFRGSRGSIDSTRDSE